MKTLADQTLLYDEDCPLCRGYTSAFIKTGMLDKNGRKPFSELTQEEYNIVDAHRACNEIALIDNRGNTVTYGIDALLKVMGNSFPLIAKVGNIKVVNWFLRKLYSFISYNRKVIIPGRAKNDRLQCVPDFNYRYRIAYLLFATLVTAFVLFEYAKIIPLYVEANFTRELVLASGQVVFQSLFLVKENVKTKLEYLGNLLTVSLFGALLLLPLLLLGCFIHINQFIALGWFGIVALVMFLEHYRRLTLLNLPGYLCITWVAYRLLLLLWIM